MIKKMNQITCRCLNLAKYGNYISACGTIAGMQLLNYYDTSYVVIGGLGVSYINGLLLKNTKDMHLKYIIQRYLMFALQKFSFGIAMSHIGFVSTLIYLNSAYNHKSLMLMIENNMYSYSLIDSVYISIRTVINTTACIMACNYLNLPSMFHLSTNDIVLLYATIPILHLYSYTMIRFCDKHKDEIDDLLTV